VKYEDFVAAPAACIESLFAHCELNASRKAAGYMAGKQYRDMNYKFREALTPHQLETFADILFFHSDKLVLILSGP